MVELLGIETTVKEVLLINLYAYCINTPIHNQDVTGYLSEHQLVNLFSIEALFIMFLTLLATNKVAGLVAVGGYVTKITTPIATKAFWWKPWLIAVIVIVAVGIIVTAVGILYSKREREIEEAKRQIPNKLMKGNKVDLSKFGTRLPNGQGWKDPDDWKIVKDFARHATKKWKLYKAMKRIAFC